MDRRPTRRAAIAGLAAGLAAAGYGADRWLRDSSGRPGAGSALELFGAPGSFGGLAGSGIATTVDVPGWGFGPGQSAYMSAVAADGTVFLATTPFSDDQSKPTGTDMELGVFDPAERRFTRLVIPSSTGRTSEPRPDPRYHGIGGADVSDVAVVPGADGSERVFFTSTMPYWGWNVATYGTLPTLGQLRPAAAGGDILGVDAPRAGWRYDPTGSWDADRLAGTVRSAAAADIAFPRSAGGPRTSRGPAAIGRLPRSGHLAIVQYFGTGVLSGGGGGGPAGSPSGTSTGLATDQGGIIVVDPAGRVRATWQYPEVSVLGRRVVVNPREITVDPTSAAGDERFVVTLDARTDDGQTVPFPVQEFGYDAAGGAIMPKSTAVRAAQDGSRMETACFGADGTLFVARTAADGLTAAALAVYPKIDGERALVRDTPAAADWPVASWASTCRPGYLVGGTARGGLVRSIVADPDTGAVLLAGLSGLVQPVRPAGRGTSMTFTVGRGLDLGLDKLRGPATHFVGVRRGAVDARRRVMWLPANQLVLTDLTWPYPPFKLDQWLYRVDLTHLLG